MRIPHIILCFAVILVFLCIFILGKCRKTQEKSSTRKEVPRFSILELILNLHRIHEWVPELLGNAEGTASCRFPGVKVILTSNPANLEYILKTKFRDFVKGEYYRQSVLDFLGESLLIINGTRFHSLSRVFLTALSSPSFRKLAESTTCELLRSFLLPLLEGSSRSHEYVDMMKAVSEFTFYVFSKAGLGVEPSGVPGSESFVEAFDTAADLSVLRLLMPAFIWRTMRVLNVGTERKLRDSRELAHDWIDSAMVTRKNLEYNVHEFQEGRAMDLLSAMILQDPQLQDKQNLKDVSVSIVLATKDTLTASLSWIFRAICQYPDVQQRLYEEVSSVVRRRQAKEPELFSKEEVREMVYLHATVSEVLRIYPTIPASIVESRYDDVLPDGAFIESGTTVFYSVHAHGRSEALWGADAKEFKPERWLQDGKFVQKSEFKFMAFNAGPRRCLGRDFAYWCMKCVVASVILRFKLRLAPEPPVVPKLSFSMGMKHGLPVIVQKRSE